MAASKDEVREAWIEATRPRTLPLAASGSFMAAGLAAAANDFRIEIFLLMFVVSVLLQVIANFADDYGDLSHGLDDETRVGPKRGMQRGIITPPQMRRALAGTCALTFVLGCLLIYVSFTGGPAIDGSALTPMIVFLVLGIAAIAAAVLYTVGPHPYGYLGLGDVMSFIFFGLVAVIAGSFLYIRSITVSSIVAGVALGLPVAAVMNINNMRDSTADAAKGKKTIANRFYAAGERKGGAELGEVYMRGYHVSIVYLAIALFVTSLFFAHGFALGALVGDVAVLAASLPLLRATQGVSQELDHTKLDRFMAPTSLGTVLVALVFSAAVALA